MEYQKIIKFLDNTPNQPSKFRTKYWVKINDGSYEAYKSGSQINIKASMLNSSLCNYSDVYKPVKGTITVENTRTEAVHNDKNKRVMFKNCAQFNECIGEINNKEIDHAKDIDVVMPMHNLVEYSYIYFKTSVSLWRYYKDDSFINNNGVITDVPDDPDNASFKYKQNTTSSRK